MTQTAHEPTFGPDGTYRSAGESRPFLSRLCGPKVGAAFVVIELNNIGEKYTGITMGIMSIELFVGFYKLTSYCCDICFEVNISQVLPTLSHIVKVG